MAFGWIRKIVPSQNERFLKRIWYIVDRVRSYEDGLKKLDDSQLVAKTAEFKQRIENGESIDDLGPEAFAVVREAGIRTLNMRHYDCQVVGGYVLHKGMIAEMKTGEGKTLVATLALYLNALRGCGSHLVTVNDYLAARDAEWMGAIYRFLGLTVGTIVPDLSDQERKAAYGSDITYGTNNEFGFDYLRDNMKFRYEDYVHRYMNPPANAKTEKERAKILNYAIVDEVDSVLIDEARTPLIISGPAEESSDLYYKINGIIPFLRREEDFVVDEKARNVTMTETGVDKVEERLGLDNLYETENILVLHHVNQALRAHFLYKRNDNYLVENGQVIIVDEFTGRKMPGRRWSDGLHQAIEAKEGLTVAQENQTLASITFQNFFRMYQKLSGMTGTADTEAAEFADIYDLDVVVIPTNRPLVRADHEDVIYKTEGQKLKAIIDDIEGCRSRGQPVLVGTTSVDNSEKIHKVLEKKGIPHFVLNAKNHMSEGQLVSQAGRAGAVTIATNMAGRGTDIMLGGNPVLLAQQAVSDSEGALYEETLEEFKETCAAGRQQVLKAGGLHILGTERHESRRIDNQLRGRAGRQGDPGSSRFFLSLDDSLLRIFGADRIKKIMERLQVPDDEPIMHKWVSKAVENAQVKVEGHNFDIRKNVIEYDDVMNLQRRTIYELRRNVLEGSRTHEMVLEAIGDNVHMVVDQYCPNEIDPSEWDIERLEHDLSTLLNARVDLSEVPHDFDSLCVHIEQTAKSHYLDREGRILSMLEAEYTGDEDPVEHAMDQWRFFEREQFLRTIDRLWKAHLVQMDHLRTGIHLESYAQKDPKLAYKKQGYEIFEELMDKIQQNAASTLFRVEIRSDAEIERLRERRRQQVVEGRGSSQAGGGESSGESASRQTVRHATPKVGRNDPCPCGSGKKYKKCCLLAQDSEPSA
jgi:preprotein translocase subunit SecA